LRKKVRLRVTLSGVNFDNLSQVFAGRNSESKLLLPRNPVLTRPIKIVENTKKLQITKQPIKFLEVKFKLSHQRKSTRRCENISRPTTLQLSKRAILPKPKKK